MDEALTVRNVSRQRTGVYEIEPTQQGCTWAAVFRHGEVGSMTAVKHTREEAEAELQAFTESNERFWQEKVGWMEAGDRCPTTRNGRACDPGFRNVLRIGGRHYVVRSVGEVPKRDGLGMGGARTLWRFLDDEAGVVHETMDLWYQGQVPEHLVGVLVDNAVFVPGQPARRHPLTSPMRTC